MTNTPIHTHPDDRSELLSGYLDRALDVAEQRQAERTIAECAACAEEVADLRALQTMLRALPAPMPRRSFTLDPATVRPRRLLFPIFRFASLMSALLLLVVVGIDIIQGVPAQPTAAVMMERKLDQAAPAAGGAATEPEVYGALTEEVTPEPPMAAMEAPATTSAADGTAADATTEAATAAEAPAASSPADATAAAESEAADAPAADSAATAEAPIMPLEAPEAASGLTTAEEGTTVAGGAEFRQDNETASGDTAQLETTTAGYAPPIDLWRILASALAVFAVVLGLAWWWTARRGI